MDNKELKQIQAELVNQYYSIKEWTALPETQNYFQYLKTTRLAFLEKLSIETSVEKIRWYQGMIQILDMALLYPEEAMAPGEVVERQNFENEE
jgi:hypothetical protein